MPPQRPSKSDRLRPMRFSIWPVAQQPFDEVLDVARHAEASGWDGVWFADHFMADRDGPVPEETPTLEAGSVVAALAAAVPRVRIGTLVYGATYRHPAVVANMAATVDHVSAGRFVLGVGAGWQVNEHEQYGITLPPVKERIDRFEEYLEVVASLLRQERTTFAGRYFQLTEALCEPKPVQDPLPILVGASGDRMLRITARHADAWNTWGLPPRLAERGAVLDAACVKAGRDPHSVERSAQALLFMTDDAAKADALIGRVNRPAYGGPPERVAEVVAAYSDAGVDELIVPDMTLGRGSQRQDRMDRFIDEVAPSFR